MYFLHYVKINLHFDSCVPIGISSGFPIGWIWLLSEAGPDPLAGQRCGRVSGIWRNPGQQALQLLIGFFRVAFLDMAKTSYGQRQ